MIQRLGLAAIVLALAWTASASADPPRVDSLDGLFRALAASPGLFARFHEEKQIALLVAPLTSDGTVHFDRRFGLARHTLAPRPQSVLLAGRTLQIWDGTRTETITLSSSGALKALADVFWMVLMADRAGIDRAFEASFSAQPGGGWRLSLAPRSTELRGLVSGIDVVGRDAVVASLKVTEASGDVSTTTFTDVDVSHRYGDAEAGAVFRVPPQRTP